MSIVEIIVGIVVLIISLLIIILTLLQDQKTQQNMTAAITGGSNDSFYGKNAGQTKEASLKFLTIILAIFFFVGTIAMNVIPRFLD